MCIGNRFQRRIPSCRKIVRNYLKPFVKSLAYGMSLLVIWFLMFFCSLCYVFSHQHCYGNACDQHQNRIKFHLDRLRTKFQAKYLRGPSQECDWNTTWDVVHNLPPRETSNCSTELPIFGFTDPLFGNDTSCKNCANGRRIWADEVGWVNSTWNSSSEEQKQFYCAGSELAPEFKKTFDDISNEADCLVGIVYLGIDDSHRLVYPVHQYGKRRVDNSTCWNVSEYEVSERWDNNPAAKAHRNWPTDFAFFADTSECKPPSCDPDNVANIIIEIVKNVFVLNKYQFWYADSEAVGTAFRNYQYAMVNSTRKVGDILIDKFEQNRTTTYPKLPGVIINNKLYFQSLANQSFVKRRVIWIHHSPITKPIEYKLPKHVSVTFVMIYSDERSITILETAKATQPHFNYVLIDRLPVNQTVKDFCEQLTRDMTHKTHDGRMIWIIDPDQPVQYDFLGDLLITMKVGKIWKNNNEKVSGVITAGLSGELFRSGTHCSPDAILNLSRQTEVLTWGHIFTVINLTVFCVISVLLGALFMCKIKFAYVQEFKTIVYYVMICFFIFNCWLVLNETGASWDQAMFFFVFAICIALLLFMLSIFFLFKCCVSFFFKVWLLEESLTVADEGDSSNNVTPFRTKLGFCIDYDSSIKFDDDVNNNINFHNVILNPGELLAFQGSSGAGKSQFFASLFKEDIMDFSRYNSSLLLQSGGKTYASPPLSENERFLRYSDCIAFVPQGDLLPKLLSVQEILFLDHICFSTDTMRSNLVRSTLKSIMEKVEVNKFGEQFPGTLSGGQKKRACFVKGFIQMKPLLLLDEPTSGLDTVSCLELVSQLKVISKLVGFTVIVVIHQPSDKVLKLFDSHYMLMKRDKVKETGHFESTCKQLKRVPLSERTSEYLSELNENIEDFLEGIKDPTPEQVENSDEEKERFEKVKSHVQCDNMLETRIFWWPLQLLALIGRKVTEDLRDHTSAFVLFLCTMALALITVLPFSAAQQFEGMFKHTFDDCIRAKCGDIDSALKDGECSSQLIELMCATPRYNPLLTVSFMTVITFSIVVSLDVGEWFGRNKELRAREHRDGINQMVDYFATIFVKIPRALITILLFTSILKYGCCLRSEFIFLFLILASVYVFISGVVIIVSLLPFEFSRNIFIALTFLFVSILFSRCFLPRVGFIEYYVVAETLFYKMIDQILPALSFSRWAIQAIFVLEVEKYDKGYHETVTYLREAYQFNGGEGAWRPMVAMFWIGIGIHFIGFLLFSMQSVAFLFEPHQYARLFSKNLCTCFQVSEMKFLLKFLRWGFKTSWEKVTSKFELVCCFCCRKSRRGDYTFAPCRNIQDGTVDGDETAPIIHSKQKETIVE